MLACKSNHPRILLADDDLEFVNVAISVMEGAGASVVHARDGQAAVRESQNGVVAAVVDVLLARLDGVSLVEKIRATKGPDFPIVVCTKVPVDPAWSQRHHVRVLRKGTFSLYEFSRAVREALQKAQR